MHRKYSALDRYHSTSNKKPTSGQTWHLPVDHNRPTYRELIALAARAFHRDAHHTVIPRWVLSDAALVSPNVREIREMLPRYALDNIFDSTKFTTCFPDLQVTTYAEGLDLTATTGQDRTSRPLACQRLRADVAADVTEAAGMGATIVAALLEGLSGAGDYVANLKVCLRAASVSHRHLGITVSAVAAYERMIGDRVQRQAAEKIRKESAYAGEITITGTVKAHEEFDDTKETVLTRTKRIDLTA